MLASLVTDVRAHWDFDGVLTDASGNGLTLTHPGTARYASPNSLQGIYLGGSTTLDRAANDAVLTVTGDLTLLALVYFNAEPTSDRTVVRFQGGSETQANNTLYSLVLSSSTRTFQYVAESGSGADITHDFGVGVTVGCWHLLAVTRDSKAQVALYIDGELSGDTSTTATAPDGGTSSVVEVGVGLEGWIGGLIISGDTLSAAAIQTQWAQVSGPIREGAYKDIDQTLVSGGVQGFWNFEDDLSDGSGNGLTMLENAGVIRHTTRYCTLNGLRGIWLPLSLDTSLPSYERASNDAVLTITGALTIHLLYYKLDDDFTVGSGADSVFVLFAGAGETEAVNNLYSVGASTVLSGRPVNSTSEFGAGSNTILEHGHTIALGNWHLISYVRSAAGDVMVYNDGEVGGVSFTGTTLPTGGTSSVLEFMKGQQVDGWIAGLLIADSEATPSEVKKMWRHIQGGDVRLPATLPGRFYRMRAFNTNLSQMVYWDAPDLDLTGDDSPFPTGDLTDIVLQRVGVR